MISFYIDATNEGESDPSRRHVMSRSCFTEMEWRHDPTLVEMRLNAAIANLYRLAPQARITHVMVARDRQQ